MMIFTSYLMHQKKFTALKKASLTSFILASTSLYAGPVMDEVIVTAQKTEQNEQDIGISITTFSSEEIKELGLTTSKDIARVTPGLHIGGSVGGQNAQYTLRGVAQNDYADHTESPIAVYFDDTYIAMPQGQTFSFFDLERIEVAKGPQSTLFGRNATGGVVHFISKKPSDKLEGYEEIQYGDYNKRQLEAAISGPLGNVVSGRLSVFYNSFGEIMENLYPYGEPFPNSNPLAGDEDFFNEKTQAVRGQLLFNLAENAELLLALNNAEVVMGSPPYQSTPSTGIYEDANTNGIADPGEYQVNAIQTPFNSTAISLDTNGNPIGNWLTPSPVRPVAGGDYFGYIDPDGDGWKTSNDTGYNDLNSFDTTAFSSNLQWQFNDISFVAITDWKNYDKLMALGVGASPVNQLNVWFDAEAEQFSQEFRMLGKTDSMQWLAGFYYLNIDTSHNTGWKILPLALFDPALADTNVMSEVGLDTDSYAIFGQIDFNLSDALVLTTGLRLIQEEKEFSYAQNIYDNNGETRHFYQNNFIAPLNPLYKNDSSDTLWAGKIQLDWHIQDNLLIYSGINRGVKAGGFNAPLPLFAPPANTFDQTLPYDPEVLIAYAAGFKSDFAEGKVQFNSEIFYYDYQDYQAFIFVGASGTIDNKKATIQGIDIDISTTPVDNLEISLGASLFDATIENLAISPTVIKDVEPVYSPDFQVTGMLRYGWPFFAGEIAAIYDFNYSDAFYDNIRNFDDARHEGYTLQNIHLVYSSLDKAWEVTAFVENFTDERYATMGFEFAGLCGCSEVAYGTPRWWGLKMTHRY
jgi:iron complex outermembrane recepter protein